MVLSIPVPQISLHGEQKNQIGLRLSDYRGGPSTLCGGCGHDSVTAAIIEACFELSIAPESVAKMSGIGCASKTPGYFLKTAHAFNAIHGRMPSVTTGAYLANPTLNYLAVSGDGDTGSIGLGQFLHAARRNVDMLYIIENNGVYGLTKGQFSALSDAKSISKSGAINPWDGIDPLSLAIQTGVGFVARGFSGDKKQLVPLLKAGLKYRGFALIDVLSPCVSFNNHQSSSRSYANIRKHEVEANSISDFTASQEDLTADYPPNSTEIIELWDGHKIRLRKGLNSPKVDDPTAVLTYLEKCKQKQEIPTGLIFSKASSKQLHDVLGTDKRPLRDIPMTELCPGSTALDQLNTKFR